MDIIIGLVLGALVVSGLLYLVKPFAKRENVKEQSVVLLEKIRNVSKLITIESDFSEIMHHQDSKNLLMNLFKSDKKALVIANSKVMVGFDMKKIRIKPKPKDKTLVLTHFPKPQVMSIETDVEYYDVSNGMFNKFAAQDLTQLNKKVRENIEAKIPQSGILNAAQEKALDTVLMIEQIVSTFGWKLDYHEWQLPEAIQVKKLSDGTEKS
jgi:hypothetical protein